MDFNNFCAVNFNGNEVQAIQQLAHEGFHQEYRLAGSKEELKTILDSMTRSQAKLYMAEFTRLIKKNTQNKSATKPWVAIAFAVFFFLASVYTFITGYTNIAARNELQQTGILVDISVIDEEYDAVGEHYYYTFSYEVGGEEYTFVDSPDRDYDVGDTFKEYINPAQPQVLVLSSSNMYFAFMFLAFSVGSLFLSKKFWWLGKYLPYIMMLWEAAMIAVGIAMDRIDFTITGSLLLAVTLLIWFIVQVKKHRK